MRPAPILLALGMLGMPLPVLGQALAGTCRAPGAQIRIDHVVVAVTDLESASSTYRGLGFTLKEGRLHSNGLRNRHVKFVDGTELELMSVGEPGDEMARGYARFLLGGEGGAYLAMRGDQDAVMAAAEGVGIDAESLSADGLRYVTFPDPGLQDLFFVEYERAVEDPDSILSHENGASGMGVVWLEASQEFAELLSSLGAVTCGESILPDGRDGTMYGIDGGAVVLTSPAQSRPRVIGVTLWTADSVSAGQRTPEATRGVWLILSLVLPN